MTNEQEYSVQVMGRNVEITESIRAYIDEKIAKVERVNHQMIDITVRIEVQKLSHLVDVVMKFSHFRVKVHAEMDDMYASIDKAFDRLLAKVRKWKGKIQDHHAKGVAVTEMEINILERQAADEMDEINDEIEEAGDIPHSLPDLFIPQIAKTKNRPLKNLTLDEALMKMELSHDNFMLYRGEEDRKLKVIYKRPDGSYGLMMPE